MRQYLNTSKKYWFLLLLIIAILPLLLIFTIKPSSNYSTRIGLWLDQPIYLDTSPNNRVEVVSGDAQSYSDALTSLLSSRDFTGQVVAELERNGYLFSSNLKTSLIEQLYALIKLKVAGQHLLLINFEADDPAFAIATLKAVTAVFSANIQQVFLSRGTGMIEYIKSQLGQAKSELDKAQSKAQQYLYDNPNLPNPANGSNFLSEEDVQRQVLLQTFDQAQNRYNLLQETLERLQIGIDNVSNGRGTLVVIKDQPAVINATVFDSTSRLIIGGGVGLVGGCLTALLLVLLLTWAVNTLNEPAYSGKWLGTSFVVDLPFTKSAIETKNNSYTTGKQYSRRNLRRTLLIILLGIGFISTIIVFSYRQPPNAIVIPVIALLLVIISRRPLIGFGLGLFLLLACEIFVSPDWFSSYTTIPVRNFNSFTTLSLSVTPVEVILVWTTICTVFQSIKSNAHFFYHSFTSCLVGLLSLFITFGYFWGVIYKHGDSKAAIVEVRALIYLVIIYFLTTCFLRNRANWKMLDWIIPTSLTLLSLTTIARFFILSDSPESSLYKDSLSGFNHDNAILFVIFVMWCLNKLVFGSSAGQRLIGVSLIGFPIFGILVSGRRAAFASLAACLIVFLAVLFIRHRKGFFIAAIILLIIVPPYMIIFRNASGPLGLAARAFSSSSAPVGSRDYSSDLYRLIEKSNVRLTIKESPITGKGFGQEFTRYNQLVSLDAFSYQFFTPHVQILWIWLKLGLGGWIIFWLLICGAIFRLSQIVKYNKEAFKLNLAVTTGCAITAIMVFAYLDLSLVNTRVMTLLGVSIGLLDLLYSSSRQPALDITSTVPEDITKKDLAVAV